MTDFHATLQYLDDFIRGLSHGLAAKFDKFTLKLLINCLKSDDTAAACIAIDQLEKEGNPLCIAPLYVVAHAHPQMDVRNRAHLALVKLDPGNEVETITRGKTVEEGAKALIEKYGHYKQP